MNSRFFAKTEKVDFAVIDSTFPQKEPLGFRNTEINEYLRRFKNMKAYSMHPMESWGNAWFSWGYGVDEKAYSKNLKGYLKTYPQNTRQISHLSKEKKYKFKLAYSYFLAETYVLLPFYEKNKIPFVFVLYPGGSFGIDNQDSDNMLKDIFKSKYFKKVIVTQAITQEYLINKGLCTTKDIEYVYGGFSQVNAEEVKPKRYYKKDKKTFDICFVSGKYSDRGVDKGYDLLVEAARHICKKADDIRFHVVGGMEPDDIELGDLEPKFTFYGYKKHDFLIDLYSGMDVFLSPNRPGTLYDGNFDGFPLAIDAPFCGVAQFASDELDMNRGNLIEDKEIVIIPLNPKKIANKIMLYYNDLSKLYSLSLNGQKKAQELFNIDTQINKRVEVFDKLVKLELVK